MQPGPRSSTPGNLPENLVKELADYVRQAQPGARLCSRIGQGMDDYTSKGDREVPPRNAEGLWEACDTSNDSWSYAWYDQNWKDSREILFGVYPNLASTLLVEFADVAKAEKKELRWMEKFGEWKHMTQVGKWEDGGRAVWTVDVATPGDYYVDLSNKGEDRLVWRIETDEGARLQNQQNAASVYHTYPFGLLSFAKAGKHTLTVSFIDGDRAKASLSDIRIRPVETKTARIDWKP